MSLHYSQVCAACGEQWWGAHACPKVNPRINFFQPVAVIPSTIAALTEDQLRQIIREEIAKAAQGDKT